MSLNNGLYNNKTHSLEDSLKISYKENMKNSAKTQTWTTG